MTREVSFVIPAYNEERLLPRTLEAIHRAARAAGASYEVVVADDASEDRTAEVAREGGARVVTVRNRQIAATRNAGAREARGDLLVFVDADTVVPEKTFARTLDVVSRGAVAGGATCRFDGKLPVWARAIEYPLAASYRIAGMTPGAYVYALRDAFEAVGGFDETVYGGEEVLLAVRLRKHAKEVGGRYVVLRERVITSGRKIRAYSMPELLGQLGKFVFRGKTGWSSRDGWEFWYGPRREDPGEETKLNGNGKKG